LILAGSENCDMSGTGTEPSTNFSTSPWKIYQLHPNLFSKKIHPFGTCQTRLSSGANLRHGGDPDFAVHQRDADLTILCLVLVGYSETIVNLWTDAGHQPGICSIGLGHTAYACAPSRKWGSGKCLRSSQVCPSRTVSLEGCSRKTREQFGNNYCRIPSKTVIQDIGKG